MHRNKIIRAWENERYRCFVGALPVWLSVLLFLFARSVNATPAAGGTLLWSGNALYPRVLRLEHSGVANGTVVAALVTNQWGPSWTGAILHSIDNGRSYQLVGVLDQAPDASSPGLCCHTLYELPTAVGTLPAGTLLWAASIGGDTKPVETRRMAIRVWKSSDQGRTWSFLSAVTTARNSKGLWEPEFTIDAAGFLVVFYSDETDVAHSQKLVAARSTDGVHWSDFHDVVAVAEQTTRPGMAIVRQVPRGWKLPGGSTPIRYLMSYEVCGSPHNCAVYVRGSLDGWTWGPPADPGTQVVAQVAGRDLYPAHTPTITLSGATVLLNALHLRNSDDIHDFATGFDGRTVLGYAGSGNGKWFAVAAPITIANPPVPMEGIFDSICPGYSSPLLGSIDGKSFLQLSTDLVASGSCRSYTGTAPALPRGSTETIWASDGSQAFLTPFQQHYLGRTSTGDVRHWYWDARDGMIHADTWGSGLADTPVTFTFGAQQHAFGRGIASTLEHWWWDPQRGFDHDFWGMGLADDPTALVIGSQQHVWAVDGAGQLQHWWWDSPTQRLDHDTWGTEVEGRPSAMVVGEVQHVFARGAKGTVAEGMLKHWWWDRDQGFQSETVSAAMSSDPVVAQIGNAQHVWAVDGAGQLRHWWWEPLGGWNRDSWGTGVTGRPTVLVYGTEQHAFARGIAGTLEHWWWDPQRGFHHDVWGTGLARDPTSLVISGQQHVWAVDGSGTLQHWWWDGAIHGLYHDTWGR